VVYGFTPQSHLGGLALLVLLALFGSHLTVFTVGALTTAILVAVAAFEAIVRRRLPGAKPAA